MPTRINQLMNSGWTRTVVTLLTLALIIQAAFQLLPNCHLSSEINVWWIVWAALLAVVYRVVNAYGWSLVLRGLGQHVDGSLATAIWLRAESRRWLPGGMWGYASRAVQAKALNISLPVASASMLVELMLTLVATLIVVVPVTLIYSSEFSAVFVELGIDSLTPMIAISLVLGILGFAAAAKYLLKDKFAALRSRLQSLNNLSLSRGKLFQALLFFVWMACLNGLVTLVLLGALCPNDFPPISVVVAATSLSWLIGFFAIFAPGGVVVREGSFAIALVFWLPLADGLIVAVAARLVQMLAEVVCLIAVSINLRKAAKALRIDV